MYIGIFLSKVLQRFEKEVMKLGRRYVHIFNVSTSMCIGTMLEALVDASLWTYLRLVCALTRGWHMCIPRYVHIHFFVKIALKNNFTGGSFTLHVFNAMAFTFMSHYVNKLCNHVHVTASTSSLECIHEPHIGANTWTQISDPLWKRDLFFHLHFKWNYSKCPFPANTL